MSEPITDTAAITAHAFIASPWWGRCDVCGFSMAAHVKTYGKTREAMVSELASLPQRCGVCVQLDRDAVDKNGVTYRVAYPCIHCPGGTDV